MANTPFSPRPASQQAINVSDSSQRVPLGMASQVRIHNDGSATVFIEFGDSTVQADATKGVSIGAGVVEVLGCGGATHVAAIAAGSTGYVRFNPGSGI